MRKHINEDSKFILMCLIYLTFIFCFSASIGFALRVGEENMLSNILRRPFFDICIAISTITGSIILVYIIQMLRIEKRGDKDDRNL